MSFADVPVYYCARTPSPPRVDGRLNDAAWRSAREIGPFILHDGSGPASRATFASLCWDDCCLYVAFKCDDPDVWGTLTKRDDPVFTEEVVEVFLDPDCDFRRYYEINVSPRNVIFDAHISNSTGRAPDKVACPAEWNCRGLRTAVKVNGTLDDRTDTDVGWTVEMGIPFESLDEARKRPPSPGDIWRVNLYRIDLTPTPEYSCWSPTLQCPPNFHVPSRFGKLVFEE